MHIAPSKNQVIGLLSTSSFVHILVFCVHDQDGWVKSQIFVGFDI